MKLNALLRGVIKELAEALTEIGQRLDRIDNRTKNQASLVRQAMWQGHYRVEADRLSTKLKPNDGRPIKLTKYERDLLGY